MNEVLGEKRKSFLTALFVYIIVMSGIYMLGISFHLLLPILIFFLVLNMYV